MAETNPERGEVNARIVYWGVEGSGKSTNLRAIHAKLRPDHRGRLEEVPTRLDPTVSYERLPIELGEIAGVRTRIQIVAVPGAPEHAPTRKQLLDRVDGIVFVVDARRERIDENVAALEALRSTLAAYGRSLEHVPLVVQYNKQDLSDPYVLEELHRKLDVRGAAAFEAVASEGAGVLQTLTTISKRVVRTLRDKGLAPTPPPRAEATLTRMRPPAAPGQNDRLEHPPQAAAGGAQRGEAERSRQMEAERSSSGRATAQQDPPQLSKPIGQSPPVSVEMATLASPETEPFDASDAAVARAQGLLDASWHEVTGGFADASKPDPLLAGGWRVVSAGSAELTGPRTVVIPLALADGDGRELRLRLAISLESLLES